MYYICTHLYKVSALKKNILYTKSANSSNIVKKWLLVDASNISLGRLATQVAILIRGKNKTYFTPHVDCGDNVIVKNANKIKLSGNKWKDKLYMRYTGYPGGQKTLTAEQIFSKNPSILVEKAVRGMLPKNKLGSSIFRNLRVVNGENHKYENLNPKEFKINF
jgi:large subunit ribosomal protein L13